MVALRFRRLESLFGAGPDALRAGHVRGLVSSSAQEAFDLDFKAGPSGCVSDRGPAGDGAALASTAGGVTQIGVQEDGQARAVAAPGVQITDAEAARIRQVIASGGPMPVVDVLTVPGSSLARTGRPLEPLLLLACGSRRARATSDAPVRVEGPVRGIGWNAGKVLPRLRAVSMFVGMSEEAMAAAAAADMGLTLTRPGLGGSRTRAVWAAGLAGGWQGAESWR